MIFSDDDVTITSVYGDTDEEDLTPKSNRVDNYVNEFFNVVGTHGWIILGTLLILIYVWVRFVKPYIYLWIEDYRKQKNEAQHHKNPDDVKREKEKLEQARLKMQKQYEGKALIYKEKMKEKERLKKEKLENNSVGDGIRLGDGKDDSDKKTHLPEYNPLMGSSSLPSYRPPRRTACSRGGCG